MQAVSAAPARSPAMRVTIFVYGVISYAMFLGVFVWAFLFVTGVWGPVTLDRLPGESSLAAWGVNIGLLTLFAVQHSLMARRGFKSWLTRHVPVEAERSTYVLASNLALILLFLLWRPTGGVVWQAESTVLRGAIAAIGGLGWLIVLYSTFLLNHFDLFGLRQVWLCLLGRPYTPLRFATPVLYRHVRHPLYVGWLLAFWGAPTMTVGHLLFALATTAYILIAIQLEERDLLAQHGSAYAEYRRSTPMLIPIRKRSGGRGDVAPATATRPTATS